MIVIDDCSKFKIVRLLKAKSDVVDAMAELFNALEIKVGRHVQTVRSDTGRGSDSMAVHKLLVDRGVEQQLTVGYSPQQNGAAERAVGVVCTMGRSIHIDAGLSAQWWGASMEHACWILNRLPTAGAGTCNPYERMYGVKPDLSQLKGHLRMQCSLRRRLMERGICALKRVVTWALGKPVYSSCLTVAAPS
jgi:transposase InsO family protein